MDDPWANAIKLFVVFSINKTQFFFLSGQGIH